MQSSLCMCIGACTQCTQCVPSTSSRRYEGKAQVIELQAQGASEILLEAMQVSSPGP